MTGSAINSALINRILQNDEVAFAELFQLCHKQLFRFADTYCKDSGLAEEIVQEAFVQLWLNREKLSPDLPLYPYLFTQARRMTIDAFRKKLLQQRYIEEHHAMADLSTDETAQTVQFRELNGLIEIAMRQLPDQQQQIFEMSRIQGLSYEEIAKQLQISKNTVKYHLVKALKSLKKALAHYEISGFVLLAFCCFGN